MGSEGEAGASGRDRATENSRHRKGTCSRPRGDKVRPRERQRLTGQRQPSGGDPQRRRETQGDSGRQEGWMGDEEADGGRRERRPRGRRPSRPFALLRSEPGLVGVGPRDPSEEQDRHGPGAEEGPGLRALRGVGEGGSVCSPQPPPAAPRTWCGCARGRGEALLGPSARCPGPQQQELNAQPQGWVWEGGSFPVWFPPPPRTPGGRGDRTKGGRGSREESLHLNPPFLFCKEAGAEHHTSYLALGR